MTAHSRPFAIATTIPPLPAGKLIARRSGALNGALAVPGDKSISHRALMIGGVATGETTIQGLLEGEDVLRTAAAMRAMGAEIWRGDDGVWHAVGRGVGALVEPEDVLDMGNAGTGSRLLLGLVAAHPIRAVFTGDASLRRRPMRRVTAPLEQMGARFEARTGGLMPLMVIGTADPIAIEYRLPVASAQVKSAVLLAGLNTAGRTTVIEPEATRDHTETMLRHFGATVNVTQAQDGARVIAIDGQPELKARAVRVPGDPSSAAFAMVAATLIEGSRVTFPNVGLNPHRIGLITTLREMGASIEATNPRTEAGEPVGDLVVRSASLSGVEVPASRAPSMIDEYLVLGVAAACAKGKTVMRGLAELRVKESDRLSALAQGLAACGAQVEVIGDDLIVHGGGAPPKGGAAIATRLDHRIAMAFLMMGLVAREPVTIDDGRPIDTSFPGFVTLMRGLGAAIEGPA